jgi:putative ABC transport system ATP-binding protein
VERGDAVISLVEIGRTYRVGPTTIEALRGVSLTVERGRRVAIMGASGSGKTTLVHLLALLDRPTRGSYRLTNREVATLGDDELSQLRNRAIGLVFQGSNLIPHRTCLDNVALRLVYRGETRARARAGAMEVLRRVGMAERAASRAGDLSGGQQQRVALARAIVGGPEVLIADEPTGALDHKTGMEILDLLLRLNEEAGVTLVVVTHDREVGARCGPIVELADGRIVAGGGR